MKDNQNTKGSFTKKQIIIGILLVVLILLAIFLYFFFLSGKKNEKNKPDVPVKDNQSILLKMELSFEINSELYISSLVDEKNAVEVKNDDEQIDTSVLGKKEVTIQYIENGKEQEKNIKINIVDTIAPVIDYKEELTTTVNKGIDFLADVKVTDNSQEEIKATIEGAYDFKMPGTYNLKYVAVDSSNNKAEEPFTLKVVKAGNSNSSTNQKPVQKPSTGTNNTTNSDTEDSNDTLEEIATISKEEFMNKSVNFTLSPHLTTIAVSWNYDDILPFNANETWVDYEVALTGPDKNITYNASHRSEYALFRDLELNTTYHIRVKAYQKDSNGNVVYTKVSEKSVKTLNSPNYSSADQAYVDNLFHLLNSNRGNIYERDAELDLAASICASSSAGLKARACLLKAGVDKEVSSWRDTRHSATSGYVTYKEFYQENKDFFDRNAYARIGVGYYKGIVHVISVSFAGD